MSGHSLGDLPVSDGAQEDLNHTLDGREEPTGKNAHTGPISCLEVLCKHVCYPTSERLITRSTPQNVGFSTPKYSMSHWTASSGDYRELTSIHWHNAADMNETV